VLRQTHPGTQNSLVDRKLSAGLLQLDGYFHVGLAHLIVVAPSTKTVRDHLDSDLPVRNTVRGSLAILMSLELETVLLGVSLFVQQMEDNFSVLHRLAVGIPDHNNIDRGYFRTVILLGSSGGESDKRQAEEEYGFK